jgi:uncharacterized protein (TIRG00374 family)
MHKSLKRLWDGGRVVLALGLLVWLFSKVNLVQAVKTVKNFNGLFLTAAVIAYLGFVLISTWRWKILLDVQDLRFSFGELVRFYFVALLFNNILPTAIGGDVMRIVYTMKEDKRATAFSATFVDRMIGFIGLFAFTLFVSMCLFFVHRRNEFFIFSLVGLALLVAITGVLFSMRLYRVFSKILRRIKILKLGERLDRVYEAITRYRHHRFALGSCLLLSLGVQAFIALVWFAVNLAAGGIRPVVYFFLYIPIIGVISMIPVTPGGLGLREASFFTLFTRVGLAQDKAVGVALTVLVISIIFGLAGGVIFIFTKRKGNETK